MYFCLAETAGVPLCKKQSYEQWGRDKGYSRDTTIISHTRARVPNKVENNETWGEEGEHGEEDASTMTMKKCCQNIIILSPTLRLHFNL